MVAQRFAYRLRIQTNVPDVWRRDVIVYNEFGYASNQQGKLYRARLNHKAPNYF